MWQALDFIAVEYLIKKYHAALIFSD